MPRTSMSIKSIWDGIDQNAFQDALEQRANKGRWATHSMTKASNITRLNHDDSSYPFSFETETNLAEYFAFLAAWKNDPHYVSAATVCLKRHQEGLLISLAANDGVAKEVHGAFQEVLTTLQQCADDSTTSRKTFVTRCLGPLIDLHKVRILRRLKCKKNGLKIKIGERLSTISNELKTREGPPEDSVELASRIDDLVEAIRAAEERRNDQRLAKLLSTIIQAAYSVTIDGTSLARRIQNAGLDQDTLQRREVHVVIALANYQRICVRLCDIARSYRRHFTNFQLNIVEADEPESRPGQIYGPKLRVHAEIQLLLYHETTQQCLKPRTIAASKQACFTCAAFISSFRTYTLQNSHGEIYPRWTVPDRREYGNVLKRYINQALRQTRELIEGAQRRPGHRAPQSVINLVMSSLRQPSMETLRSRVSNNFSEGLRHIKTSNSSETAVASRTAFDKTFDNDEQRPAVGEGNSGQLVLYRKASPTSISARDVDHLERNHALEETEQPHDDLEQPEMSDSSFTTSSNKKLLHNPYLPWEVPLEREPDETKAAPTSKDQSSPPAQRHDSLEPGIDYFDGSKHTELQKTPASFCEVSYCEPKPWVRLYASMDEEDKDAVGKEPLTTPRYSRATCSINRLGEGDLPEHVVDVDDIDDLCGITLEKAEGADILTFVLQRAGCEGLFVQVEWNNDP